MGGDGPRCERTKWEVSIEDSSRSAAKHVVLYWANPYDSMSSGKLCIERGGSGAVECDALRVVG